MTPARKIVRFGDQVGFENSRSVVGDSALVIIEVSERYSQIVYSSEVVEITDAQMLVYLEEQAKLLIEKCRFMGLNDMHISDIFYYVLSGGEAVND